MVQILAAVALACVAGGGAIALFVIDKERKEANMRRTEAMRAARHNHKPDPEPERQTEQPTTEQPGS